jgi:hypothetical protein
VVVAVLVPAELAGACSCAQIAPRDKLEAADAGVIGRVVKKTLVGRPDRPLGRVYRYRVRVNHWLKRRLGAHIKLRQHNQSAACGFEWKKGERVAAYLYRRGGRWTTNLCGLERPRVMRRLARGLVQQSVSRRRPPRSQRSTCR